MLGWKRASSLHGVPWLCVVYLVCAGWSGPLRAAAAIAAAQPLATAAGLEVLAQGGNAFDAAIATAAALAVVEPAGSGLGGGGFFLLHHHASGRNIFVDARETAPRAATPTMYRDSAGQPGSRSSRDGPLAAGIPGLPAALAHLSGRYARLPRTVTLAPAIRYACEGFTPGARHRRLLAWRQTVIRQSLAAAQVFLVDGMPPPAGARLVQRDLCDTLRRLAERGHNGFYAGATATKLVQGVRAAGGIWSYADLSGYRVKVREPLQFQYAGWQITAAPPPSAGGIAVGQSLPVLDQLHWAAQSALTRKHLVAEVLRRAYLDRQRYLGDPDFVDIPLTRLLGTAQRQSWLRGLRPERATPSAALGAAAAVQEGDNTTHFSIVDDDGNRVAATLSVNFPFGAGFVPPGTGVLLNDEMDDFAAQPGAANGYGLVGGAPNAIAPGKRMLSSMTPVFVENDRLVYVLGTPGGSRIVSMVLIAMLELTRTGDIHAAVAAPRYHHQFLPDRLEYEPGALTHQEQRALMRLGHTLKSAGRRYGDMQIVLQHKRSRRADAASDPRGEGWAAVQ